VAIPEHVQALREKVGTMPLWLPGVTAVVRREGASGAELLMVRRADNGRWTPVTGISDPGEEPAETARRETLEETGVVVEVERVASVSATGEVVYPNGDRAAYLDVTLACRYVGGEAHVADDESSDVRWWPVDALPEMEPTMAARVADGLADKVAARFVD
jgi:ADP-ribose pyrophosphatase YjhB (NUDIX family)